MDPNEELRTQCAGNSGNLPEFITLVYDELRRLASFYLRSERPGHTLQTTALVHEGVSPASRPEASPMGKPQSVLRQSSPADAADPGRLRSQPRIIEKRWGRGQGLT